MADKIWFLVNGMWVNWVSILFFKSLDPSETSYMLSEFYPVRGGLITSSSHYKSSDAFKNRIHLKPQE